VRLFFGLPTAPQSAETERGGNSISSSAGRGALAIRARALAVARFTTRSNLILYQQSHDPP
jgi:hypothetical protein